MKSRNSSSTHLAQILAASIDRLLQGIRFRRSSSPDRVEQGVGGSPMEPLPGEEPRPDVHSIGRSAPDLDALVSDPDWGCLFTPEEKEAAAARLREKGQRLGS